MRLYVSTAIGRGSTELSAFDAALVKAGVANFNLIRLSSVIPPSSTVEQVEQPPFAGCAAWGDRLYAVYAEQRTSVPGEQVWAGVGWAQDPSSGHGLFVEHEGHDEDEVRGQLDASLRDLQRVRGIRLETVKTSIVGAMCAGMPTCALVICAYGTSPWGGEVRPMHMRTTTVPEQRTASTIHARSDVTRC